MKMLIPPIKCQGIKTKLVPAIKQIAPAELAGVWIEPFCGSCVVALNVQPKRALLADTNTHIIAFYRAIQDETITPRRVRAFLQDEGRTLAHRGDPYYYEVRARFNASPNSLDFLFLSRACFNGVMRFNQHGKFNVPFGHKPERFSPAYITKIVNQVQAFSEVMRDRQWRFEVADFRDTLAHVTPDDFIYADPPYAGRHVDYFSSWGTNHEEALVTRLKGLTCAFLLSTWHANRYRANPAIDAHWTTTSFSLATVEHFYHVGATENLRNAMIEALVTNYPLLRVPNRSERHRQSAEERMEQCMLNFT